MIPFHQLRNLFYYHLGFKLINLQPRKHNSYPVTVQKINGKQVRSNIARTKPYSFDSPYWDLASRHPEQFV